MGAFLRLSLPSATGLLAVATIGGVAALYALHFRAYSLVAMVPVIVVAAFYLRSYAQRPLAVPPPRPPRAASPPSVPEPPSTGEPMLSDAPASLVPLEPIDESEPFDDPVEEADRLGSPGPATDPPAP